MKLNDDSPMPFGKFKDKSMQDVPASYFHWLWNNGKQNDHQCPVAEYIRDRLDALAMEYPDGIWEL